MSLDVAAPIPFLLDPGTTFLNHGSFGALPRAVQAFQRSVQAEMDAHPVRFMTKTLPERLPEARAVLAQFLGAAAEDLVFVANATAGVGTVLRSFPWTPGDRLLLTNHGYNACANVARFVAERHGVAVDTVALPWNPSDPEEVLSAILGEVGPRTRLALIDHVTSPTALVLPVEALVQALESRGVATLIDGAHAPGMLDLDLETLGASYYTGNCHKWLCSPKGAAVLVVRPDRQQAIEPLVISHGRNRPLAGETRMQAQFSWSGTDDPSAHLAAAFTVNFLERSFPGGWAAIRHRNRELVGVGASLLSRRLGWSRPIPATMVGSMETLVVPGPASGCPPEPDPMQAELAQEGLDCAVIPFLGRRLLRLSAHIYNTVDDYSRLVDTLERTDAARGGT